MSQGQLRVIICKEKKLVELEYIVLHARFYYHTVGPLVLWEKVFEGFYHIWAWWPSWSCDLSHEAQYKILL